MQYLKGKSLISGTRFRMSSTTTRYEQGLNLFEMWLQRPILVDVVWCASYADIVFVLPLVARPMLGMILLPTLFRARKPLVESWNGSSGAKHPLALLFLEGLGPSQTAVQTVGQTKSSRIPSLPALPDPTPLKRLSPAPAPNSPWKIRESTSDTSFNSRCSEDTSGYIGLFKIFWNLNLFSWAAKSIRSKCPSSSFGHGHSSSNAVQQSWITVLRTAWSKQNWFH